MSKGTVILSSQVRETEIETAQSYYFDFRMHFLYYNGDSSMVGVPVRTFSLTMVKQIKNSLDNRMLM